MLLPILPSFRVREGRLTPYLLRYALSNLRLCLVTYNEYAPVAQSSFSSPNSHLCRESITTYLLIRIEISMLPHAVLTFLVLLVSTPLKLFLQTILLGNFSCSCTHSMLILIKSPLSSPNSYFHRQMGIVDKC